MQISPFGANPLFFHNSRTVACEQALDIQTDPTTTGPTDFVFIHGGASGAWKWQPTLDALKTIGGNRIGKLLAVDFPGCGTKRDWDVSSVTFEDEVQIVLKEVEDAGIRRAVIVGHSLAGTILPVLVVRRPDLWRRSVFLTCIVPEEGQSSLDLLGPDLGREDFEHLGIPAHVRGLGAAEVRNAMWTMNPMPEGWVRHPWGGMMDEATAKAIIERTVGEKRSPAIHRTKVSRVGFHGLRPVTYIVGLRDATMTPAWQQRFIERLGDAAVQRVEFDAGHNSMVTHPAELAALLLQCAD